MVQREAVARGPGEEAAEAAGSEKELKELEKKIRSSSSSAGDSEEKQQQGAQEEAAAGHVDEEARGSWGRRRSKSNSRGKGREEAE